MSIVCKTENGWVIDHRRFINEIYSSCKLPSDFDGGLWPQSWASQLKTISVHGTVSLRIDRRYFALHVPYVMDSQVKKMVTNVDTSGNKTDSLGSISHLLKERKRKRKRRMTPNTNFAYHEQIKDAITMALNEFTHLGHQLGIFSEVPSDAKLMNNKEAREAANRVREQADGFADMLTSSSKKLVKVKAVVDTEPINDLTDTIIHYSGNKPCLIPISGNYFVIPPNCSFYISDIKQLSELVTTGQQYDFIVMDCPWVNKSVKRKKGYCILHEQDFVGIPIESLSNDGCIIAVWVTNNQNLIRFIQEELFPSWNVKFCAIWHWVKITISGEVICDLESHHKKPYEHIIIGQKCEEAVSINLENDKVICSVPSSIHSHKPPLQDIFQPYLKNNSKKLELFARYLLPGWTSWGNEVLLLQHIMHFEMETAK